MKPLSFDAAKEGEETLIVGLGLKNLLRFSEYEPGTLCPLLWKKTKLLSLFFLSCSKSIRLIVLRMLERLDFADFEMRSGWLQVDRSHRPFWAIICSRDEISLVIGSWERRTEVGCFEIFKRCFDTSYHLLVGSDMLPTCANQRSFKNVVKTWWAMNSGCLQFNELHVTHLENSFARFLAKHHLLLRQIFANTIFCWMAFVIVSVVSSFAASFFISAFVLTSLSPRRVSTPMFKVVCTSFLWARSASVEWSVTLCAPAWSSLCVSCFQRLSTSVLKEECCCCWLCQFFFNVTLGAGLGAPSLSKITRSPSWEITRSMQSPGFVA